MGTRVGMLATVLILVLGSGVVGQDPEPTPLFAPDDLVSTIPSRVGDYELRDVGVVELDPATTDALRDLLPLLGKEPKDVTEATGKAYPVGQGGDSSAEPVFGLGAIRVERVPAARITEPFGHKATESLGAINLSEWRVIDGRDVYSITTTPEKMEEAFIGVAAEQGVAVTEQQLTEFRAAIALVNAEAGYYLYPKGEVLFAIIVPFAEAVEGLPTVAEILAELP